MKVFGITLMVIAGTAIGQTQGPSTTRGPEFVPAVSGARTVSLISNGNGSVFGDELYTRLGTGAADYRLIGIPDGMGGFRDAQDVANGTFSIVVNHELGATSGVVRAHGSRGASVSRWRINADANDFRVIGGDDLIRTVKLWNTTTNAYETYNASRPLPTYANNVVADYNTPDPDRNGFARFCSADMADATAYRFGELGTDARILLNGEENGAPGRGFAHIASGDEAGTSYELPDHGDYSFENNIACPYPQAKTICVGFDDSTPGNVYIYIGQKQSTGNTVEKAGLVGGRLYAMTVPGVTINQSGQPVEDRTYVLGNATDGRRESARWGTLEVTDPRNRTGAYLQSLDAQGQMNWARPEDGAWDPLHKNRLVFATTDSFTGNSRLWMMTFDDIANPEAGGTVTMLCDGSNPASFSGGIVSSSGLTDIRMMDNICFTKNGIIMVQEDVGNNPRLGRLWAYDLRTDRITEVASASPALYENGVPGFVTQDEESSGIFDAHALIGPGWFMIDNQSHYAMSGELAEGGQVMALYYPGAVQLCPADANADGFIDGADYGSFVEQFESGADSADFNGDGFLDLFDYIDFVAAFEKGC